MHELVMDSMAMKNGQHHGHDEDYGGGQWVEINGYNSAHQSPIHEYNSYGFISPTHLPLEPTYNRTIPPPYSAHQPLQPLVMPQWPSQLTNPSNSAPPAVPGPPPLAPLSTMTSAHPLPPPLVSSSAPTTNQRRTLTDQDRRRMCQYHEDNPTVKQTEIGAMFGVERSTVSKVLRQKDKYLFPDDGSRSPIKRSKGKFPDIERALSNWARNHQRQGLPLNDSIIRDKARFFATTVGSSDSHAKVNSTSWLEKFKQKNHLLGAKPRKASDANDSDSGFNMDSKSGSNTPNGISPISPGAVASPLPLSPNQSHDNMKTESPDSYLDFTSYRHTHSQSTTSLASVFSETTAPSSFSNGPTSPTSPFYSPDHACAPSPFIPSQQSRLPSLSSDANNPRRRSQTFPMVGVEPSYITPPSSSSDPLPPKYLHQPLTTTATLDSPVEEEMSDPPLGGSILDSHSLTSSSSPTTSMMAPPPNPDAATAHASSPISSPTQDDARNALELLMTFCKQSPGGLVEPQEYITMGKLMEKLKVREGGGGGLPGGMHALGMGVVVEGREREREREEEGRGRGRGRGRGVRSA